MNVLYGDGFQSLDLFFILSHSNLYLEPTCSELWRWILFYMNQIAVNEQTDDNHSNCFRKFLLIWKILFIFPPRSYEELRWYMFFSFSSHLKHPLKEKGVLQWVPAVTCGQHLSFWVSSEEQVQLLLAADTDVVDYGRFNVSNGDLYLPPEI